MATVTPGGRIVTLDIVRGVAVMGILAMNIVGFAMPQAAYMNPAAYGTESVADTISWVFSFIFIDGRMRGFFSFLFGASMLLVIERAEANGLSPARVHYARMIWLLVFGLIHFYFIWFGDILSLYAVVGMIAFAFRKARVKTLVWWAVGLLVVQFLFFGVSALGFYFVATAAAAPGADAETVRMWNEMRRGLDLYDPGHLQQVLSTYRGGYTDIVAHQFSEALWQPLVSILMVGWETLAYFLLGMAAYRTGFLTGLWSDAAYRRTMLIGFGVGIPVYALLAWILVDSAFYVPTIFAAHFTATVPVRPLMIAAIASLVILSTRGGGAFVERIAAAGRAAFTNYLGTSILMTFIFYGWGLGLFGQFSRAELWLFVIGAWVVMLVWSKPWLDRFRYGPFEWLWRSLARGRVESLSRRPAATEALV